MLGKPIHENLSTSFVDLTRLVRHLRNMQFVGTVRIEFSSYEAEIIFTPRNRLQAREYDRMIGRITQGERAFSRILERSREPMGRIHVVRAEPQETIEHLRKAFIDDRIVANAREAAFGRGDTAVGDLADISHAAPKAQTGSLATALATELIMAVKDPFDRAKINFDKAFADACLALAEQHPFLEPRNRTFAFENEKLHASGNISTAELFEGVASVLTHLIVRLRGDAKFGKLLIYTRHRLQQHLSSRHDDYSKLGLIPTIDRILA
jgi:hypothetical protein